MEKKRHKTFVKFTNEEHPLFRPGEIGVILRAIRPWRTHDGSGNFVVERRGGEIQTLDGKKKGTAIEGQDYVRIAVTPAIEILYGKYIKLAEPKKKELVWHGKKQKYTTEK